jgi:hypothetical protein
MRLPAELERSATELPAEFTALLTPPERRVLLPCATPERTSPAPVCRWKLEISASSCSRVRGILTPTCASGERLMRLPAELDRSATELPVELTALLAPPERRVLVPCAAPDSTSPRPVCRWKSEISVFLVRCFAVYVLRLALQVSG